MPQIDPSSRVADGAKLADDVEVGPFCSVGPGVELRAGVRLLSHVNVTGVTAIGERTVVISHAVRSDNPAFQGLLVPNLESGDLMVKQLVHLAQADVAGLVLGIIASAIVGAVAVAFVASTAGMAALTGGY